MTEAARNFSTYLLPNNIICGANPDDWNALLRLMLDTLKRHFPDLDREQAEAEILKREALFPTMIAPGLAVPHARLPGLDCPLVALAICPDGVEYSGQKDMIVKVAILILSATEDPTMHLQLLSALSESFREPDATDRIAKLNYPEEIKSFFSRNKVMMRDYLTAADVMLRDFTTVRETNTIRDALELFATKMQPDLLVLDATGDLRGVVSLADLLKFCLPEHILWMEDLSSIYQFQPFKDMLESSGDTKIADVMRSDFVSVREDAPAIQLAKLFLVDKAPQIVILDAEGKAVGIVVLHAFCAQFFWE